MPEDEIDDAPVGDHPNQIEIDAYEGLSPERRAGVPVPDGWADRSAQGAPAAPAAEASKPAEEEPAAPGTPETPPAAPTDPIAQLLAEHKIDPADFAASLRENIVQQTRQLTEQEREDEIDRATASKLQSISDRLDAGTLTEDEARAEYLEAREVAAAKLENAQLKAQLAQRDRAGTLDKVRAEFDKAPAGALERFAATGASADDVRTFADELHQAFVAGQEAAIANYVAQRGAKNAAAVALAPAGGASPTIENPGPSWESVRGQSWSDLLDPG